MNEQRLGGRAPCPHCTSPTTFRTSRQITAVFRETRLSCSNDDCGWKGVASLIIERTIVQSAIPDPRIELVIVPPRVSRRGVSDIPAPANDDETLPSASALPAPAR